MPHDSNSVIRPGIGIRDATRIGDYQQEQEEATMTELNDDTVIGILRGSVPAKIRLSDLDEPYQEAVERYDELCSDYIKADDRIAELEAKLAKAEAALKASKESEIQCDRCWAEYNRQAREAMK